MTSPDRVLWPTEAKLTPSCGGYRGGVAQAITEPEACEASELDDAVLSEVFEVLDIDSSGQCRYSTAQRTGLTY